MVAGPKTYSGVKPVDAEHERLLKVFGVPQDGKKGTGRKPLPRRQTIKDVVAGSVPAGKLANVPVTVADTRNGEIGGGVKYGQDRKTIIAMLVPEGNSSYDSTVRGHETRHATWSKRDKDGNAILTEQRAMAKQIVEDCFVEQKPLPIGVPTKSLLKYKRRALATACKDIREGMKIDRLVKAGKLPDSVAVRNAKLLAATRAMAILESYGQPEINGIWHEKLYKIQQREMVRIHNQLNNDPMLIHGVQTVVSLASRRSTKAQAVDILTSLQEATIEDRPKDEPNGRKPPNDPSIDMPVEAENKIGALMTIRELRPRTAATVNTRTVGVRFAPNGVILNPQRFVPAIVEGNAHGLFRRRTKNKVGGTVLIDASGSMGANAQNLKKLCAMIPTATVAYYSGTSWDGDLCIYAKEGKRFNQELPEEWMHGGNTVDLPAIQWLLKQPKPWVLISDLQFCGGRVGNAELARAIVTRLEKRGDLLVIPSFKVAFDYYKKPEGEGKLPATKHIATRRGGRRVLAWHNVDADPYYVPIHDATAEHLCRCGHRKDIHTKKGCKGNVSAFGTGCDCTGFQQETTKSRARCPACQWKRK